MAVASADQAPIALSKAEIALALRVSQRTVNNWVRHRGLPCVRVGSRVLFMRARVEDWLGSLENNEASEGRVDV